MPGIESAQLMWLFLLGAAHGVNPAMGWLFAVARGFQERERRAVWEAIAPLAAGHALAIAAALAVAAALGALLPMSLIRSLVGAALIVRGVAALVRHSHPRGRGMQMGARTLAWWSFLMATAHGAGLMALPLVMRTSSATDAHAAHAVHAGMAHGVAQAALAPALPMAALHATLAHAAGYLAMTALLAFVVYEYVGVRMLRSAWINVDLLWAGALIVTGVATVMA